MNPETFPERIDVSVTARCNLDPRCPMCIGPERNLQNELTTDEWKSVVKFFANNGTKEIIFTGGEPLMKKDVKELLKYAKESGLRVTLSTNALLLTEHIEAVVKYVDDVGIPIDGSTSKINSRLRPGDGQQLEAAISAISLLRKMNSKIEITIRTVLTRANIDDLSNIGRMLLTLPRIERWKLYELLPSEGLLDQASEWNWDT